MRKIAVAAVLFLSVFAPGQSKAERSDVPGKALMAKILAAWSHGGPAEAAVFYDKSPDDVYYDVAPLKYQGFADYQKGAEGAFDTLNLTLGDDPKVHLAGNLAWGTSTFHADAKLKNGNRIDEQGRWTVVWQKKNGKWLMVHEHVSFPWTPPTERRQR
jgi:ketosteroid isomerase-like protein